MVFLPFGLSNPRPQTSVNEFHEPVKARGCRRLFRIADNLVITHCLDHVFSNGVVSIG